MSGRLLATGVPAPAFECRTPVHERFFFDTVAGRYVVLSFFGSAGDPAAAELLHRIVEDRARFNDVDLSFFGVSIDPEDERRRRVANSPPGIRFFWDFDHAVSARYGASQPDGRYRRITYVLDPALRVLAALPMSSDGGHHAAALFEFLDGLPPLPPPHPAGTQAPVLCVPRIFEPEFCDALIGYYAQHGGTDSGFMVDVNGKTTLSYDYGHKRRRDCVIEDEALRRGCMVRIHARLVPEIHKAFQFEATRLERYVVACYDAAEGGHFKPHRDNTTKGTAHRRFAVSLFLNTGQYQGGQLRFPEFGSALYEAPAGGAVVFSCSLLHAAAPVTHGCRYMFLPFLYDEAGRRVREENLQFLADPPREEED